LSLDRIRGAIPANGRLTKSRQQPAEPTCAYRGERASPDDARELARDSAVRRAHSTDVRRTRHACAHFLLCRTRHGKLEVGQGRGRRGSVNAAVDVVDHRPGAAPAVPRGLYSSCRLGPRLGRPCRNEHAGCTCGHGRAADKRRSLRWCGWRGERARRRCQPASGIAGRGRDGSPTGFQRPAGCEKVLAACQRSLLSHRAAVPCRL
jgi:hypothetical protein